MELLGRLTSWAAAHRWRYAALILAVVVLQGVVVYGVLTSTTEITTKQALEEFRRRQQEVSAAEPVESSASPAPASVEGPAGPTTSASKARGEAQPAAQPGCEWVCATNFSAPPAGVYDWFQCGKETGQCTGADTEAAGSESFGGLGRPLPRTGRRSIIVVSANRWTSYHQYADEHKEEFDLYVDPTGVFGERYKVDIKIARARGAATFAKTQPHGSCNSRRRLDSRGPGIGRIETTTLTPTTPAASSTSKRSRWKAERSARGWSR